ncbi:sensor domain-containing diguanylate cyclase [Emcibacter sp. SYSU 3D8]|uniref:sensor domain-containing diguanylate cyclase n=1 Tax=Emcibacter sp. SYSU 3D8 TaxID=3133969 RepID=UPI0031FF07BB
MLALEGRVRLEQTRMMYRTPVIPLLNVVTAGITAAALSPVYPASLLVGWIVAFIIIAAWRLHLWQRFSAADQETLETAPWRHRFVSGAVATGCLWGLAGSVVFITNDVGFHVFVVFVLGGMTAGAMVGNATYMPAFYGFALPAILPMAMMLFIIGDGRSVEMALLLLAFSAVLAVAGRNMHRWIESSTRLQIEREQLIDRLRNASETLEREIETGRDREIAMQDITAALEDRTRSVHLLNGMVQRLQEATTDQELSDIVGSYAPQIVPGRAGILFLMNNSQNMLSAIASWGDAVGTEPGFAPDDCWALRRSQVHLVPAGGREVRCQHEHPDFNGGYACYPLLGRGSIVGLLYIEGEAAAAGLDEGLSTLSSNLGLALANYRLREALRVMSLRDPLTGLFNRRYLEEALVLEFGRASRSAEGVGVIVGDLDHFKLLNDTHGHDGGDAALRAVSQVLVASVRKGDIACRYGGEEFVLVMPSTSLDQTRERAEDLRRALEQLEVPFHGKLISPITMSIGVAAYPKHGSSPDAVLRQADKAMYQAKQSGRNRVVVAGSLKDVPNEGVPG